MCSDKMIKCDYDYLQASNNFRFMTTKRTSVGLNRGIYDSPYDAFTNYMNIIGDFINRVNRLFPVDMDNEELNSLITTIHNQSDELELKDKEIEKLRARLKKYEPDSSVVEKAEKAVTAVKKTAAKKPATKKAATPKKATPAKKKAESAKKTETK